jgi:polysaccharide export outer membrane protein
MLKHIVRLGRTGLTLAILLLISSCAINPSIMFKSRNETMMSSDSSLHETTYRISPGDLLQIDIYTNKGVKLVDQSNNISTFNSAITNANTGNSSTGFLVEQDGLLKAPLCGRIAVTGLTIKEIENLIETCLKEYYTDPFVIVRAMNRRVVVFTGTGGAGQVIELKNENMDLIEVLAEAGGLTNTGKAKKIKILRGGPAKTKVIHIDLSTIDTYKASDLRIMPNDIVYVEPVSRISQEVLSQIAPVVGIITSLALIYQIASGLR